VWQGGDHHEEDLLASCYRRSMEVADELGARTVAFPAISTGVYGFPKKPAARIAVSTLRSLDTSVEQVVLVAFDQTTLDLYESALVGICE
jgi:O-acetyl-ADP-ribose deacetylase